jgi:AraC-like DNA-binding protein
VIDPLAEVVRLLRPGAPAAKVVTGAGTWSVHRSEAGRPFFCSIIQGSCRLAIAGRAPIVLQPGDFVLVPSAYDFTASSPDAPANDVETSHFLSNGEVRHGHVDSPPDVVMVVGYCEFTSSHARLLVSLLPDVVHVSDEPRLSTLTHLVSDEYRRSRPGRDVVLAHLVEVLLIEALRSASTAPVTPGLVRGLADARIGLAIRAMHDSPATAWTIARLAREAALSRSAFFERFTRTVGVAPIEYLLSWRMALAQDLLRHQDITITDVAKHVGYSSASTLSVAFTRHVGTPPTQYAREVRNA